MHSNQILTLDLYWLVLTLVMTSLFWMPYVINRIFELGAWQTLRVPKLQPDALWANRLMRAHANAVENLVIFAPLVLAIQLTGMNSTTTAMVCMVYFYVRLVHVLAYVVAIPVLRTLAFTAGFFCQMTLAFTLLGYL